MKALWETGAQILPRPPQGIYGDQPESGAYAEHQRVLKENAKLKQEVESPSKVSVSFASK